MTRQERREKARKLAKEFFYGRFEVSPLGGFFEAIKFAWSLYRTRRRVLWERQVPG